MKFGDRYIKFMKDRYGIDELYTYKKIKRDFNLQ